MQDSNPDKTPLSDKLVLTQLDSPTTTEEQPDTQNFPYLKLVGSLMYAAIFTRPDLSFAAQHLSQFSSNPGMAHWQAAMHVF